MEVTQKKGLELSYRSSLHLVCLPPGERKHLPADDAPIFSFEAWSAPRETQGGSMDAVEILPP